MGVRTPKLRAFAKAFAKTDMAEPYLNGLPHYYLEENGLHAFLIENIKDYDGAMARTEEFLPYIDNWATCDSLSPKVFKKHRPELIERIKTWITSERTYTVRYGLGMLMEHFLDEDFQPEQLDLAASVVSGEYYVNMMQAWYFATALAKQYDCAVEYIRERRLQEWVHNKTIQKSVESRRITPERKEYLKSLRLKRGEAL